MTLRFSTGARNGAAGSMGLAAMFNRGWMGIYSGAQPASADAAVTGTLLGIVSADGSTLTKETRATGSVTITGVTAGSINSITVGGLNIIPDGAIAVEGGETTSTMAAKLAEAINRNGIMEARVSGAVVTLYGRPGTGVTTAAVSGSLTTVTASYVNMGSGVAGVAPVNGLLFGAPESGVIAKSASQIWKFTGIAAGTAGWYRLFGSDTADTGGLLTAAPWYPRVDGSIGVGSGDLQLGTTTIGIGSPNTIDTYRFTAPNA